jgi:serine/threonine protein kinase/Tfp pilus assembly protein PilF
MNEGPQEATANEQAGATASRGGISECPKCGTKIPASRPADRCPVCQLRSALAPEVELGLTAAGSGSAAPVGDPPLTKSSNRFAHYELYARDDGTPIVLGRGAMGVTYRAFDSNLRCPVALKVINARYLNDESARRRFVREARAAARLRHPNAASVFHLGKKNGDYFYAMEFVEGETLDQVITSRGPMPWALALDITGQVAAALEAAHKEQIVHRDIKPGNLMLRFVEGGSVNVKVIDFGLAKAAPGSHSEAGISTPGSFTGTALFASPEQCVGDEVDIRSDIYSLGVTLWEMLTAKVPFGGNTVQVMSQHLHAPLPVEQLKHVPQPVVDLLKRMLEKDPAQRPQNPSELRAGLRAVRQALEMQRGPKAGEGELPRTPKRLDPCDRISPSARGRSTRPRSGYFRRVAWPRVLRAWWVGAGAILVAALGVGFYFLGPRARPTFVAAKSVAVLPFDNLSDSKQNEYFSDGLTSEVIYQLSKVADLRVIARSSILRYKDITGAHRRPLNEIGAELDVAAILESSVQRAENRVKIVTILYDARTNQRLWGATYDRELKDVFAIQSDLAEQIAAALQAKLSTDERASLQRGPTGNLTAYDLYLQGKALSELDRQEDNDEAVQLFKRALEQDPKFVLAYVGLADAYIDKVKRFHGDDFWLDSAIDLCQQAIALDPKQLRAYTELANAFNLRGWFDRMNAPVRTALELAPNDWDANRMAAAEFTELRREDEMYASIRKCFVTNPFDSWAPYELALICWSVGEKDLAEKWMQRAIYLENNWPRRQLMENERLVYRGEYAAALPGLRQLPADLKTHYTAAGDLALFCSMRVGDWPAVVRTIEAKADNGNPTSLLRLALAFRGTNRQDEARQTAERVVALAQQKLPTAKSPRWMRFDLAIGNRLLERKDAAYQSLRDLVANGGFPDPVLGRADPGLDLFEADREFQSILAELDQKNSATRARILEIEKNF